MKQETDNTPTDVKNNVNAPERGKSRLSMPGLRTRTVDNKGLSAAAIEDFKKGDVVSRKSGGIGNEGTADEG
jgi:hypothetical protein